MTRKRPLLDSVEGISDLRSMSDENLVGLVEEVRAEMIESVAETGGHLDGGLKVRPLTMPDHFIEQNSQKEQLRQAGLDAAAIAATALSALGQEDEAHHLLAGDIA